jgi:putative membrane protein
MGFRYIPNAPGDHWEWLHGLFTLLVVAAIVAGIVIIARQWLRSTPGSAPTTWSTQSPGIHELDVRYARGEIERTDYLQRRADILGAAGPPPAAPPST